MTPPCGHLICELVGGACSLATGRSRGCRPNLNASELAAGVVDEVRELLAAIAPLAEPPASGDGVRTAATRLAAIIRREAREDRNLAALVAGEEPELVPALARLCVRRRAPG